MSFHIETVSERVLEGQLQAANRRLAKLSDKEKDKKAELETWKAKLKIELAKR